MKRESSTLNKTAYVNGLMFDVFNLKVFITIHSWQTKYMLVVRKENRNLYYQKGSVQTARKLHLSS